LRLRTTGQNLTQRKQNVPLLANLQLRRFLNPSLILMLGAFVTASVGGCNSTVILVPPGTPVQLAEPVKARVFVVQKDGTKVMSSNRVEIPAGWWAADVPEDTGETPAGSP
jgi:hypothetical protein